MLVSHESFYLVFSLLLYFVLYLCDPLFSWVGFLNVGDFLGFYELGLFIEALVNRLGMGFYIFSTSFLIITNLFQRLERPRKPIQRKRSYRRPINALERNEKKGRKERFNL